jgi:hypothetical protein
MTAQNATDTRWVGWIFLGAAAAVMLGSPVAWHAINVAFRLTNQPAWFLFSPIPGLALSMVGFLRLLRAPHRPYVQWSILASGCLIVVLSVLGIAVFLWVGITFAMGGAPNYDLP